MRWLVLVLVIGAGCGDGATPGVDAAIDAAVADAARGSDAAPDSGVTCDFPTTCLADCVGPGWAQCFPQCVLPVHDAAAKALYNCASQAATGACASECMNSVDAGFTASCGNCILGSACATEAKACGL
jgi:hypothetical protein